MARSNSADRDGKGDFRPDLPSADKMKFEAALTELEQIVQKMEEGQLPLEDSIAAYRRGCELLKHCQQQLNDAEKKVQVLEDGTLRNLDADGGEDR